MPVVSVSFEKPCPSRPGLCLVFDPSGGSGRSANASFGGSTPLSGTWPLISRPSCQFKFLSIFFLLYWVFSRGRHSEYLVRPGRETQGIHISAKLAAQLTPGELELGQTGFQPFFTALWRPLWVVRKPPNSSPSSNLSPAQPTSPMTARVSPSEQIPDQDTAPSSTLCSLVAVWLEWVSSAASERRAEAPPAPPWSSDCPAPVPRAHSEPRHVPTLSPALCTCHVPRQAGLCSCDWRNKPLIRESLWDYQAGLN